jgi:thiamine biosynthesis lipoprotein
MEQAGTEVTGEFATAVTLTGDQTANRYPPAASDPLHCPGRHRSRRRHRRGGGQGASGGQRVQRPSDAATSRLDSDDFDDGPANHHDDDHYHPARCAVEFGCAHHDPRPADHHDDDHPAAHDHDEPSGRHFRRDVPGMSPTALSAAPRAVTMRSFRALGTTATVVVRDGFQADKAQQILQTEISAIDRTCSRFRSDSELAVLHANAGRTVAVSSLLFEALDVAYSVAERTQGAVDPTVGRAMEKLGYDRDFEQIETRPLQMTDFGPVPGFRHLHLDRKQKTARIPRGVLLDLGSSAKALLADRAAAHVAHELGSGALVSIGGDIAVAGEPPSEGWAIGIAVDSSMEPDDADQVVAIRHGGLASSGTEVRTWPMGGEQVHHIVDPATGRSAVPYWRLVSAAGASCVDANALSTASIVWGDEAVDRLRPFDQAVRLQRQDGKLLALGGWPEANRR